MSNTLAKRLRELRLESNYTQEEIAKKIGLKKGAYGAYERGSNTPDAFTLLELAKIYGTTVDYLLGASDEKNAINKLSYNENKLLALSRRLTEKQIESLVNAVIDLIDR